MEQWEKINTKKGIEIEKLISEYDIGEQIKTPWSKFKIRIYKKQNNSYRGITNLMYKHDNVWQTGIGFGNNELEALENTISDFMLKISSFDESLYDGEFDENAFFKVLPVHEF